ncbi:MAG: heme A synthase [Candidatus Lutacidiplasmatales archaeon]
MDERAPHRRGHDAFRYLAVLACLLCYVTIMLGGNVMASDSGLACPDWPTCHGTFAPPLAGGTGVEWTHRLSAAVLSFSVLALAIAGIAFERSRPILRNLSIASLATVFGQGLLGGLVVRSDLVIGLVLAHLALATVLFGLLLIITFLGNLREIPKRYIDWAHKAAEEQPVPAGAATDPAGWADGSNASPGRPVPGSVRSL